MADTQSIPVPPTPSAPEAEPEIQTIPDQFYGAALKAKPPAPHPKKKPEGAPGAPGKGGVPLPPAPEGGHPRWILPVVIAVVFLAIVGGGFWYFNSGLFNPPAPAPTEPEPTPEPEPVPEPPTAPTNVVATSTTGGGVRITWEDQSQNEAGFRVERRESATPYVPLTSLPPNATVFLDTTTEWETSYLYRIVAINADGESQSQNEATVETPPDPSVKEEEPTLPPAGLDTDSDGLTDLEEPLYGSPPRDPDADKDTFLDGNEVFHLYTPSGKAPGRLLESGLVRVFESALGWHLYVPVTWQSVVENGGSRGNIFTGHGEIFRISVQEKPASQTILDWYLAANPGVLSSDVTTVTTKGGLEGISGTDPLTTYFGWDDTHVLVFQYSLEGQPFVNFRTTYEMMKNSLSLDPYPVPEEPAAEEEGGAAEGEGAGATATSTTP